MGVETLKRWGVWVFGLRASESMMLKGPYALGLVFLRLRDPGALWLGGLGRLQPRDSDNLGLQGIEVVRPARLWNYETLRC